MCVCVRKRERERERVIPVSLISIVLAFCILSIILHTFCNRLPSILVIDFLIFFIINFAQSFLSIYFTNSVK